MAGLQLSWPKSFMPEPADELLGGSWTFRCGDVVEDDGIREPERHCLALPIQTQPASSAGMAWGQEPGRQRQFASCVSHS